MNPTRPDAPPPETAWCDALDRVIACELAARLPLAAPETLVCLGYPAVAEWLANAWPARESRAAALAYVSRGYARADGAPATIYARWKRALSLLDGESAFDAVVTVIAQAPLEDVR